MEKSRESSIQTTKANSLMPSILVIDDSSDTLALHRILLELEGYKVFTAESGMEALAVLSGIDEPNLILLDMQMGEMNGADFLVLLEEKMPEIVKDVPIVFLTGMDEVPKSKAVGFIRKPADKDEFLEAVHRFIEIGNQAPYRH